MSISLDAAAVRPADAQAGDRTVFARRVIVFLAIVLLITAVLSLASGATDTSAVSVVWALVSGQDDLISAVERVVILDIRMPRTLLGMMIGATASTFGQVASATEPRPQKVRSRN